MQHALTYLAIIFVYATKDSKEMEPRALTWMNARTTPTTATLTQHALTYLAIIYVYATKVSQEMESVARLQRQPLRLQQQPQQVEMF